MTLMAVLVLCGSCALVFSPAKLGEGPAHLQGGDKGLLTPAL